MKQRKQSRMTELLEAAADRFDDHGDPFSTEWLAAHDVTLDECMTLSEQIAVAVRNYARLDNQELAKAMVRSITKDTAERESMLAGLTHAVSMSRVLSELSK